MLDLAISVDSDSRGSDIVETNHGEQFECPSWPRDCEFQLVAFRPGAKTCEPVWTRQLADDIGSAIRALEESGSNEFQKSDWYVRLIGYAARAP